jgi:hypothetical protein
MARSAPKKAVERAVLGAKKHGKENARNSHIFAPPQALREAVLDVGVLSDNLVAVEGGGVG